jgi:hypothetical protein
LFPAYTTPATVLTTPPDVITPPVALLSMTLKSLLTRSVTNMEPLMGCTQVWVIDPNKAAVPSDCPEPGAHAYLTDPVGVPLTGNDVMEITEM